MSDEPVKKPSGKSILEGSLAQVVGTNIAGLYVLNEASKKHFFPPGYEVYLAGAISVVCYALYKLFGPRLLKWARRR